MKPLRVLGLGSPCGDDQLGWRVIAELERSSLIADRRDTVELLALDRTHATLLEHLAAAELVILVDGVAGVTTPGTILEYQDVDALDAAGSLASQGWGLAASLQLAAALGQLPARWHLLGVSIDAHHGGALLSDAVFAAVPLVAARIEHYLLHEGAAALQLSAQASHGAPSAM